ncbi:MAG TPA: hypothetical protein VFR63_00245 [Gaiellaceae bacterium]|nr:hypothetical protein [Gaiellaceae bacterium]
MGLLRRRLRLRPLDERECYLRLHGARGGQVEVVRGPRLAEPVRTADPQESARPAAAPAGRDRRGPTDSEPALHLIIAYPRAGGRMTGEQLRRQLLARMERRPGEAA